MAKTTSEGVTSTFKKNMIREETTDEEMKTAKQKIKRFERKHEKCIDTYVRFWDALESANLVFSFHSLPKVQ